MSSGSDGLSNMCDSALPAPPITMGIVDVLHIEFNTTINTIMAINNIINSRTSIVIYKYADYICSAI